MPRQSRMITFWAGFAGLKKTIPNQKPPSQARGLIQSKNYWALILPGNKRPLASNQGVEGQSAFAPADL